MGAFKHISAGVMVLMFSASLQAQTLTRDLLDQSLTLGRGYLLNHQRDNGGFDYEYDFIEREVEAGTYQHPYSDYQRFSIRNYHNWLRDLNSDGPKERSNV